MSRRELTGRTALVTGVTRRAGIGASIARELGRAGAKLFVTYFRHYDQQQRWGVEPNEPEAILDELGSLADAVAGAELDLSLPDSPADLFGRARQRFGQIDILVNNAAHWEAGGIADVGGDQLDRHCAVNVRASVLLCAEFARQPELKRPRRIISITSGQGHTPMPGEIRSEILQASPGSRISSPDDIAQIVRYLSGDAAASITGQIIRAQGGGLSACAKRGTFE